MASLQVTCVADSGLAALLDEGHLTADGVGGGDGRGEKLGKLALLGAFNGHGVLNFTKDARRLGKNFLDFRFGLVDLVHDSQQSFELV